MRRLNSQTGRKKTNAPARKARPVREAKKGLAEQLHRAVKERDEALEFQSATGEILASIRSSATDAKPVFDAIVSSVLRLFGTRYAAVFLLRGDKLELAAVKGDAEFDQRHGELLRRFRESFPQPVEEGTFTGKVLKSGQVMQLVPIIGNPQATPHAVTLAKTWGYNALVVAPLVRDGQVVGCIGTAHPKARRLGDKELSLLKAFADQAVIAIENARLFNETREALERQTATSEILRVISSSPIDVQPVFDIIVRNAVRLCSSLFGAVFRYDGELVHFAAGHNFTPEALANLQSKYPVRADDPSVISARAITSKAPVQIDDVQSDPAYDRAHASVGGWRRMLAVPMLREGVPLGAIVTAWAEPGSTPKHQQELLKTFADQAVIAIENVRLFNETKESLEQQTAISEVLRVISSSPGDVKPVLDTVAQRAARICDASDVRIFLLEGERLRHAAGFGDVPMTTPVGEEHPLDRGLVIGRAVIGRNTVHVEDLQAAADEYPLAARIQQRTGQRTTLAVPLLRENRSLGAIMLRRMEVRPFTDKQIALLRTFADQAAIAIENVRLFDETKEALERQTATAEILKVISSSPTDVQPVFDAVAERAGELCNAMHASVLIADGNVLRRAATVGHSLPFTELPIRRTLIHGRAFLERRTVHVEDIVPIMDAEYPDARDNQRSSGFRTLLSVPMIREGKAIGTIGVWRREVKPFTRTQIELLETFAAQAVIAIENVRLFNETKEALEQQTAISEILRVISASPSDVQPVLEAVAERAMRICDASDARVLILDGENLRHAAGRGNLPMQEAVPVHGSVAGRAVVERRPVQIDDMAAVSESDYPFSIRGFRELGTRMVLAVPLLRENHAQGAIVLRRQEVRPFTDKQIALLKTFADQAAIAIENVRLFNETREALEQQKASADVLGVISSSIADTKPVFDKILESCRRLFAGRNVGINVVGDDGRIYIGAYEGAGRAELEAHFPVPLSMESGSGAAIVQRQVVHYPDCEGPGVPEYARLGSRIAGNRSVLFAPMLWEGKGIGAIFVGRPVAGPFSEKEIALLKTFADQAAIAIQNARLFKEIQEKSAQLEVANKHKSDFLANMSHELRTPLNAIIGFSEALMERMFGEVNDKQADYLKDIHESGRHLLSLINDILDLSKIEAGRMELDVSSFHLPTALSNAMTLIRERAQRHGIELGLEVDQQLGEFQADERKFKQIMLNLLSNAVKFTPDGGRVDVCVKKDTDKIEIAVKDTGIGIAPEDQAVVFEEFKQVGRDRMRQAEGTGLGLALTRRFVELHGGAIRLESTPGKGSTFTVSLPLRS
jgi:GAF domain-containing protein/anti-sigma regulatory factor (Ser/Thr protein kinase)